MDTLLCDELLQEIFHRLPPPSTAAVSLVSERWHRLLRSSTTTLSLHFPLPYNTSKIVSFLISHPFLSNLSIACDDPLIITTATCSPNLRHLSYLSSPVSPLSLQELSGSCLYLSSIAVAVSRPLCLYWVVLFKNLKCLTLYLTNPVQESCDLGVEEVKGGDFVGGELSLESLCLSGVLPGDYGVGFLWRVCRNVKRLQLKSCESLGDYASFSGFVKGLSDLQVLELRTCRSVVDLVLLKLAECCVSLECLLVYDGGSKEGLLRFIDRCKCRLRALDLRLPLDLHNSHLIAMSENLNFRGLVSLRLQSCCLVTGEGLKAVGRAMNGLEELALINCDVVEKEPGLLASLGQCLKRLRKLDLSYSDMLLDKELMAMLVSCNLLCELKLRGCSKLTDVAVGSIVRSCKQLQSVDVMYCCGIKVEGVEFLVMKAPRLERVEVEQSKVSEDASRWASRRFIEVVS